MAAASTGAGGPTDPPHSRPLVHNNGAAGENMVRAVLEGFGAFTSIAPASIGYDLAAYVDDNRWIRVQVKSTNVKSRDGRYQFKTNRGLGPPLTSADCDVVAFVALPLRLCLFRNVRQVRGKTFKLTPSKFQSEFELSSWIKSIK